MAVITIIAVLLGIDLPERLRASGFEWVSFREVSVYSVPKVFMGNFISHVIKNIEDSSKGFGRNFMALSLI